jgi:hypothetical protein
MPATPYLCVSLGVRDLPDVVEPGLRVEIETPRRIYDRRCPLVVMLALTILFVLQ